MIDEAGNHIIGREERIEYRDEDGNLLNEDEVAALDGAVSFQTRYETKTRLVDEQGNEIGYNQAEGGVAPPHPDVENVDAKTKGRAGESRKVGAEDSMTADAEKDLGKEQSLSDEAKRKGMPRPGSERDEATSASF